MTDNMITNGTKDAVFVAICSEHRFRNCQLSKWCNHFCTQSSDEIESLWQERFNWFKEQKYILNSKGTQQVQYLTNADPRKSMKPSHKSFGHRSRLSELIIRYNPYVLRKRQMVFTLPNANRLISCKRLLTMLYTLNRLLCFRPLIK